MKFSQTEKTMENKPDKFDYYYNSRIKTFFASELMKRKFEYKQPVDEYNWLIREWDLIINEIGGDIDSISEYEFDIWSKDRFIMTLLNKYRLEKIGITGIWYSIDEKEYLYNYIKERYSFWLEKMYTITTKYNIYANLLVHPYDISDFLKIIVNKSDIPFYNPFMISIKNIPNYIKYNYNSSNVEVNILHDDFDYKTIMNLIKLFRIIYYKMDKELNDDDVKFYLDMYDKDKVKFTSKGIKRKIIGLLIYDLEGNNVLRKDKDNKFIYSDFKLELVNNKIDKWIGAKNELALNTFLNNSYEEVKIEICNNKHEKQDVFLERKKISNCGYDIFMNEDMLAYVLLDKLKTKVMI